MRTAPVSGACALLIALALPAQAGQPLNGDFSLVGANGSLVSLTGNVHDSRESAAKFWDQTIAVSTTTILTELLPSTHPLGGTMLRFWTDGGYNPNVTFGNGLGWARGLQKTGIPANTKLSFDIFVVSGSITGGLVNATGPFFDFTPMSPTGSWRHVEQVNPNPSGGIAFQNLVPNSGAEFFLTNVRLAAPEPGTLPLLALGGIAAGGLLQRRIIRRG